MATSAKGYTQVSRSDPLMDAPEELATLIKASQRALFAYIRTLIGPTGEVDDVLQEVNLILWRKGHELVGQGRFLNWACHVAYMQVLAYTKKRRRDRLVFLDEAVLSDLAERMSDEVNLLNAKAEALQRCIGKLPPEQRRLIQSRYEKDGSARKLASELRRPVASVSVTLHRIRQVLADCVLRTLGQGTGV